MSPDWTHDLNWTYIRHSRDDIRKGHTYDLSWTHIGSSYGFPGDHMNVTYVSLGGVSILIFKVLFSYNSTLVNYDCQILEAAIQRSFVKKVFFEILHSSRENL